LTKEKNVITNHENILFYSAGTERIAETEFCSKADEERV